MCVRLRVYVVFLLFFFVGGSGYASPGWTSWSNDHALHSGKDLEGE